MQIIARFVNNCHYSVKQWHTLLLPLIGGARWVGKTQIKIIFRSKILNKKRMEFTFSSIGSVYCEAFLFNQNRLVIQFVETFDIRGTSLTSSSKQEHFFIFEMTSQLSWITGYVFSMHDGRFWVHKYP